MTKNITTKSQELISKFSKLKDPEDKFDLIIDFAKHLERFNDSDKTEENRIKNCQSTTYIKTSFEDGRIKISSFSDSMISYGLSTLLVYVYNGESAENILKYPPNFLNELGLEASISPNRSNGLYYMYERLKKDAINYLTKK